MIRIELGSQGLGRTRFAMSPLNMTEDLLFMLSRRPQALGVPWRARAVEALRDRRLGLLAVVAGGGPRGYAPDFPRPEPATYETSLETELHQVATTPAERITFELTAAFGGHSWDQASADKPPRLLLAAMERGTDHLAGRIADEMDQFWRLVLAPGWPRLRARLEGDISTRSTAIARDGLTQAINQLDPVMAWREGGLDLTYGTYDLSVDADAAIFVPSPFVDRAVFCAAEPAGAPDPRTPLIVYPAHPEQGVRPSRVDELIGATRAQLLAELTLPRTTGELAQRLHLSTATVSYHLQILHRAGLVQRTRRSRSVLYQNRSEKTSV